jgi:hypothetical protein
MSEGQTIDVGPTTATSEIGNKTATDAKAGLEALSSGLKSAFSDKEEEYARRIVAGENPASMGVPASLQEGVRNAVDRLQQKSTLPAISQEEGATQALDFGTTDEELEQQKAEARAKIPETQPETIDFGTTEGELGEQKAIVRAYLSEIEKQMPLVRDGKLTKESFQELVNKAKASGAPTDILQKLLESGGFMVIQVGNKERPSSS